MLKRPIRFQAVLCSIFVPASFFLKPCGLNLQQLDRAGRRSSLLDCLLLNLLLLLLIIRLDLWKGQSLRLQSRSSCSLLFPRCLEHLYPTYPTSGIRRAMDRPNCTVIGGEIILYGYFDNTEKNIDAFFGPYGVSNKEVPPFHDTQNYISLRASPKECLERSTWGKGQKEYVLDRNLCYYQMRIPKASCDFLFKQKIIKELGKDSKTSGGKQWIHLQKNTNVKSKATYNGALLWEAKLLTKIEMENLCEDGPPPVPADSMPSAGLPPPAASAPGGIWKNP